jgi:hypothetical protein
MSIQVLKTVHNDAFFQNFHGEFQLLYLVIFSPEFNSCFIQQTLKMCTYLEQNLYFSFLTLLDQRIELSGQN